MALKDSLRQIKRSVKRNLGKLKKIRNANKDTLYLSFGENCLTDNILSRYHIKSYSTPYSSGRSNIEYILQLEKNRFKDFLNTEYMNYAFVDNVKVVRLNLYKEISNEYADLHMNGFEFTHHDVIGDSKLRETFERRFQRLLNINKKLCIFYHSRYNQKTNEKMLIGHLKELKSLYEERTNMPVNVIMFTQVIIEDDAERRVTHDIENGIHVYKFHVKNIWGGTDQDIFWARCDDDLIKTMIEDVKKL